MTNHQILEMAIQKAIDGGWKPESSNYKPGLLINPRVSGSQDDTLGAAWSIADRWDVIWMSYRDVIYNHDFAKALWGVTHPDKQALLGEGVGDLGQPEWQYHLQQMVIADDPIDYLGSHLDD